MKFLIVLKSNIKRITKNKKNLMVSFLIPGFVILFLGFAFNKVSGSDYESAVINSDKGTYGQEFINEIKKNTNIKIYEKNDGLEAVKKKRIQLCYEIPENFSQLIENGEKPAIISHKLEKGTEPGNFSFNANSLINKMLLRSELKQAGQTISLDKLSYEDTTITVTGKNKQNMSDTIILNVLISFSLFTAIGISLELSNLKKENILKRSFSTGNKAQVIIGGILGAIFITTSVEYCLIFLMNGFINSPGFLSKAPIIMINITFMVLLSLSLGVFITRILSNESLIPVILQIIICVSCFIGGSFMPIELLPKGISIFSKFTPQYWALQSINTNNVGLSFIVVLFALALFTAGTFKAKNYMGEH